MTRESLADSSIVSAPHESQYLLERKTRPCTNSYPLFVQ